MPNDRTQDRTSDAAVARPAAQEPRVLYYGPEAPGVASCWNDDDRPFELLPAAPEEGVAAFTDAPVDCVVCHDDGDERIGAFLEGVRAASEAIPIIVFATGDGLSTETALAVGATAIDIDGAFEPIDHLEGVTPVVERHRREVRNRTMLDSLLEQIPLSVYWKDRQSRHVEASEAMLSMIGPDYMENEEGKRFHHPADIVGNTDWDLYPQDLAESATADDEEVMATEEPIVDRVEHSYGSPDEGTYVATSKAPWYDEQGRVVGLVGVTRDVSERMQYERQLERQNERLERFAKVISHDLRNPLEVARGRLELARSAADPTEHYGAIERALERMDGLIDDVLTLARKGEVVDDPVPVDIADAARDAWDIVESGEATLSVPASGMVLADEGRLRQILENLFRNAIDHAAPEGEPLTVTVGELPSHGFYVEDDGVGIPEGDRERIFDPGYSDDDGGTGLGLGIVRTIAEAHGWRVELEESEAGGARFEFRDVQRVPDD